MDERVGWLPVPSCTGIYQLIWVQRDWREGRKREMKKGCEAWPASSDRAPREVTHCFGETSGQHIHKAGRKKKKTTVMMAVVLGDAEMPIRSNSETSMYDFSG